MIARRKTYLLFLRYVGAKIRDGEAAGNVNYTQPATIALLFLDFVGGGNDVSVGGEALDGDGVGGAGHIGGKETET